MPSEGVDEKGERVCRRGLEFVWGGGGERGCVRLKGVWNLPGEGVNEDVRKGRGGGGGVIRLKGVWNLRGKGGGRGWELEWVSGDERMSEKVC